MSVSKLSFVCFTPHPPQGGAKNRRISKSHLGDLVVRK
jgi:hypothetical protein